MQSLLAKKLAVSVLQVADLEEKKGPPTALAKGKRTAASAGVAAVSEEKKLISPSEEKKAVVRSCAISLMDVCRLDTLLSRESQTVSVQRLLESGEAS